MPRAPWIILAVLALAFVACAFLPDPRKVVMCFGEPICEAAR